MQPSHEYSNTEYSWDSHVVPLVKKILAQVVRRINWTGTHRDGEFVAIDETEISDAATRQAQVDDTFRFLFDNRLVRLSTQRTRNATVSSPGFTS